MRTVVVIPTIRNLDCLEQWRGEFDSPDVKVIAVEDHDKHEIKVPEYKTPVKVYSRNDVKKELGRNSWIFPKFSSSRRSFGIWKAWQLNPDMIVTLDDDCYPERPNYFLNGHWDNLQSKVVLGWTTSLPAQVKNNFVPRGYPYMIRRKSDVVISHGLWSNIPDLDAPSQLVNPDTRMEEVYHHKLIPIHNYFPMCGMNLAWRTEWSHLMYFGLQGPDYPFSQFDDIWMGIIAKKILDHDRMAVVSGHPSVKHNRASNVFNNLKAQAPGISMNELFWRWVDDVRIDESDEKYLGPMFNFVYKKIAQRAKDVDCYPDYFKKLAEAAQIWTNLFR